MIAEMYGSESRLERRSVIVSVGTAAAVGLAGCLGDDEDGDPGDDGAPEDDDGGADSGGENEDTEPDEVEQPNWVLEADDAFGRIEPDYDSGLAAVEIRGAHISEPDEVAAVTMYDENGDEVVGSDFDAPEEADVVDVPITSEAASQTIVGEVTIAIENDFGDELHSTTWDLSPDVEVIEFGMADDLAGFDESQFYITFETASPSAHIHGGHLDVDSITLDGEDVEVTDSPDGEPVLQDMDGSIDNDLILGHGESIVVPHFPRLQWRGESSAEQECGAGGEGRLELEVFGGNDVDVGFEISTGSATEVEDSTRWTCDGVEIDLVG